MNNRGHSSSGIVIHTEAPPIVRSCNYQTGCCPENQVWWTELSIYKGRGHQTAKANSLFLFCLQVGLDTCQHWWKSGILLQLPNNLTFSVVLSARANNRFTTSFLTSSTVRGKRNILDIVDVDNSTTKIIASCCLPAKKGKIRIRKHEQLQQHKKDQLFFTTKWIWTRIHQKWEKF